MKILEGCDPEELPMTGQEFQRVAADTAASYLAQFERLQTPETASLKDRGDVRITVRVEKEPPSVQIVQQPHGGTKAGAERIREKLQTVLYEYGKPAPGSSPIILPKADLQIADQSDLTRECILTIITSDTANTLLEKGLLAPTQAANVIQLLQYRSRRIFMAVQRYLLGIEPESKVQVPYSLIETPDDDFFAFMQEVSIKLAA